jgi:L-2-hydroxyglutarate oxidase LhgO
MQLLVIRALFMESLLQVELVVVAQKASQVLMIVTLYAQVVARALRMVEQVEQVELREWVPIMELLDLPVVPVAEGEMIVLHRWA